MKKYILFIAGVLLAIALCLNIRTTLAERYEEVDGQTLVDTKTGAVWERVDEARDDAILQVALVKGTWKGSYTGYSGGGGLLTVRVIQQVGSKFSGNMDISNTDCVPSNLTKVPFTGVINVNNVVSITAKHYCSASLATLKYTEGKLTNGWIRGTYVVLVNGTLYDSGTFKIKKIVL